MKTDCGYLRNGMFVEPTATNGKFKPCCLMFSPNKNHTSDTVEEQIGLMNNPEYLYENFKDDVCYKCNQQEKINSTSGARIDSLKTVIKNHIKPGQVTFLQVAFSAFCNFKCLYCGPHSSTEWNNDVEAMTKQNIMFDHMQIKTTPQETFVREKETINDLKKLDLSELREVGVFGGEPFMTRHLDEFLNILVEKGNPKNIIIQINTNASVFPKDNIINSLLKFDTVDLRISGESVGGLAEYIRNGLIWDTYNKNINKWKQLSQEYSNIELKLHMAHCVYNINKLQETEEWLLDNKLEPYNAFVRDPDYTDARKILSVKHIKECVDRIKKLKTEAIREPTIKFLTNNYYNQEALSNYRDFTQKLDNIRGTSLQKVNSELYNWTFLE
jgi:organic radical activating enzyme